MQLKPKKPLKTAKNHGFGFGSVPVTALACILKLVHISSSMHASWQRHVFFICSVIFTISRNVDCRRETDTRELGKERGGSVAREGRMEGENIPVT